MSLLPYSFLSSQNPNDVDSCARQDNRNALRRLARSAGDGEDDNDDIAKLSTSELKMTCHAHGLNFGGRNQDLITWLVPCLEIAADLMNDGKDANESNDAVADTWKQCWHFALAAACADV